ncbi:MAG: hypothetical protein E6K70_14485 [Planctomycetota bacterium]|nr:MAG: hypothetical protein E6K70_14485 [Planctomycetota bacterium]
MSVCLKYNKALAALALLAALGCGQNNMVPVKGTVTLDGQPIEGALVKFIPPSRTGTVPGGTCTRSVSKRS